MTKLEKLAPPENEDLRKVWRVESREPSGTFMYKLAAFCFSNNKLGLKYQGSQKKLKFF